MSTTRTNNDVPKRLEAIVPAAVRRLAERVQGPVLAPGDSGYDAARRVFNAMIDRYPAVIVRCAHAEDVVAGVAFAREHDLDISVRGGGHGVAGNAVAEDGLMLDLSAMKGADVDPARRLATVQPGLTLGDLDDETQRFGLATPTGVVSMTGVAGLTLGGGVGWLNGAHGLSCDNLVAADVVLATGERVTAGEGGHEDLLWGLRGGGANLGVVTSFTFRLHAVDEVLGGAVLYSADKARDALRLYDEFARDCRDELSANASLFRHPDGNVGVGIGVCCTGSATRNRQLLSPLRALGPDVDTIGPMSYRELQRASDEGFPPGQQHYWKSGYITELGDDLIDVMLERVTEMPSLTSGVGLQQLHGAASRVAPSATAFAHRGDRYDCLILSQWPDPARSAENIAWTRGLFDAIRPYQAGVYVNNMGADDGDRVRQPYGLNYDRLAELKRIYDPTNVFCSNQNIAPGPSVSE